MVQAMTPLADMRAYSTQGLIWLHMPAEEAMLYDNSVFRALRRGKGGRRNAQGQPLEGIDYSHVCLYHGHPVNYDIQADRFQRGIFSLCDNYKFKVLMTVNESEPLPIEWINEVRGFDMILVPSKYCKRVWDEALTKYKKPIPVHVVPHGVEDWLKPLPDRGANAKSPALRTLHQDDKFKFLTVFTALSYPKRKGIDVGLKAFFNEFKPDEKVVYIIRTEDQRYLQNYIAEYPQKAQFLIIDEKMVPSDLVKLYNIADCLVYPSRGEAWGLDLMNSIACGLPSMATKFSGPLDYANGYTTWIPREKQLVPGIAYANPNGLYAEPNVKAMQKAMREATVNHVNKRKDAIKKSVKFRKNNTWDKAAKICVDLIEKGVLDKYGSRGMR
jgi:glycosyltransferase involved in cell wall biosynthesis